MISPKQLKILAFPYSKYDAIICDGSIRSGKTSIMTVAYVDWAMDNFDRQRFIVGGKTVESAVRNVIEPYRLMSYAKKYRVKWSESKHRLTIRRGSRENYFDVFGGKDKASFMLVQGFTAAGCFIDEVALCERSFVEQAIARCSVDGSRLWFNCNPGPPKHWFRVEWILQLQRHNALHLHFTMDDNPSLSPHIRERYERMYSGVFKLRYIDGLWVVAEGLVYPMWSDDFISELPPKLDKAGKDQRQYIIAIDYGIKNPFAAIMLTIDGGKLWAVDEYRWDSEAEGKRRTDEEHYDAIDEWIGGKEVEYIVIDPSATSFRELLNRKDKYWHKGADNAVLDGISKVSTLIGSGLLMVSQKCTGLLEEFGLYCWDPKSDADKVVKESDHFCDGLRYGVQEVFEDIMIGQVV